jgi:nickel-dependent lactate racemase
MDIQLGYGRTTLEVDIPKENILGFVEVAKDLKPMENVDQTIFDRLQNPIDCPPLKTQLHSNDQVVIVVNDATRRTPTQKLLPAVLRSLKDANIPREQVKFIFATGTHRATTDEEAEMLLGTDVSKNYQYVSHDCEKSPLTNLGKTSRGTPVLINSIFMEADVKILISDITFHYYAGYGGGRKSVLPGIAGKDGINHNHCLLTHPKATSGNLLDNPIHLDMTEGVLKAQPTITINAVENTKKEIAEVFVGDVETAFQKGVDLFSKTYKVPFQQCADIVVVSAGGWPSDINLYQAHKSIHNAQLLVKEGGTVVATVECPEGVGHEKFTQWMKAYPTLEKASEQLKTKFELGGHKAYYLMKNLQRAKIVLVSKMSSKEVEQVFQLTPAKTLEEGLSIAFADQGKSASVYIFKNGTQVLPTSQ